MSLDLLPARADLTDAAARGTRCLADGDHASALPLLRAAVDGGDRRPVTRLNLALAEQHAGDLGHAAAIMLELEQREPGWAEPPLRLAELWRAQDDLPRAITAYEGALERDPARFEALLGLATLRLRQGEPDRAQTLLLRCCAARPLSWQAWDALGTALTRTADFKAAHAALARAHALEPRRLGIALRLAEAAIQAGDAEAALAALAVECEDDPLNAAPLAATGVLLARADRPVEAASALEAAAALAPDDADLAALSADGLLRGGQHEAAVPALRHALDLDRDNPLLRNNYAASLTRVHRYREARCELESLLPSHGDQAGVLCNLAAAQVCLGEQASGVATARRATELAPESHLAWRTLANALSYAQEANGEAMLAALRRAGELAPRGRLPPFTPERAPDPDRRLRVGLLSAMLRTHPVGWLALAGIETLDPAGFELVCLGPPDSADPMQRRFRRAASEWHELGADPAAHARALRLDVLIDLGGYGDLGLLACCAERLAPVQIKWVGMQNHSTGLAEMDWFITDRWETPPSLAATYSERLLVMPDGYACYTPPPHAPDVAGLPALRRGHVTFGCFNNYAKITPAVIAAWCDILRAVPDARLVLKTHQFGDPATAAEATAKFAARGIDPTRIELRGASPHRALLEQYGDIDIVLDPHPYSGGLTTCEALWMGVPVLTVPGTTFASRHSTSHLCNVGLGDWVAADLDAYRAQAVARAADIAALASVRRGLRTRMKASPLCDAPRFGRNLGACLRSAWRDWCETQPG